MSPLPHRLDEVRNALVEPGMQGLTVTGARGFCQQKGRREIYRGAEYETGFPPKTRSRTRSRTRVEVAAPDSLADRAVDAIRDSAGAGQIGDGKIFVLAIEKAARIRTGETDDDAL